jgi:hypothetical protein
VLENAPEQIHRLAKLLERLALELREHKELRPELAGLAADAAAMVRQLDPSEFSHDSEACEATGAITLAKRLIKSLKTDGIGAVEKELVTLAQWVGLPEDER